MSYRICAVTLVLVVMATTVFTQPNYPIRRVTSGFALLVPGTNDLTTSAEALAATDEVNECLIQNDPDNTTDILIGNVSLQVIQLAPGDSIVIPIQDPNTIHLKAVSGTPTANYLCR